MTDTREEALRREVGKAMGWSDALIDRMFSRERVQAAFDALRDHYQARPTFEGDEAEVREELERCAGKYLTFDLAARIRALLDAKDAAYAEKAAASENHARWHITASAERDEALAAKDRAEAETSLLSHSLAEALQKLERAEQALAAAGRAIEHNHEEYERIKQALAERDAAIVEAVRRTELNLCDDLWAAVRESNLEPLRPFLPAKPDPLVDVLLKAHEAGYHDQEEHAQLVRAFIERAGGTISFEGEG